MSAWKKKKKGKTSKFVDAEIRIREKGINMEWIDEKIEKKNKSSGTERCENFGTLNMNKNMIHSIP